MRTPRNKYHGREQCSIEPKGIRVENVNRLATIQGAFCRTHRKEICKCGWEFGFHYATPSVNYRIEYGGKV